MDDSYEEDLSEGIVHQSSIDSNAMDEVKEDNEVCEICLDGEVFDDNEILFCDKCNVAVHQLCYGVKDIPQDSWFCFPCQEGLDPKTLPCELCSYTGGAYKRCTKGGSKWAHPLCASWIPEVYEVAVTGKPSLLNLERLDQKRYKLKCGLCTKKGACVQCAYGRCTQGMHPWCALRSSVCTRRIIKGDEGILLWEIFCKTHAKSVGEAPKHRSKAKASKVHEDNDGHDEMAYWSHEQAENEEKEPPKENSWKTSNWSSSSVTDGDLVSKTASQLVTELMNQELSKNVVHLPDDQHTNQAVVSLLEWPGMSEGEAMDLDHFWNYVSSYFVEDQGEMWVEKTLDVVKKWKSLSLDANSETKANNDDDLDEAIDDALAALGGERDKAAAMNESKRNLLLARVGQITKELRSRKLAATVTSHLPEGIQFENEMYLVEEEPGKLVNDVVQEEQTLNVVFDGDQRVGCKFTVAQSYFPNSDVVKSIAEENNQPSPIDIDFNEWATQNIIPRRHGENSNATDVPDAKELELTELIPIPDKQMIQLSDGVIRAKSDLSELTIMMLKDISAYKQLSETITSYSDNLLENSDLLDSTGKFQLNNLEWKEVNNKYMNQQIWKKIGQSLYKGINHLGDETTKNDDEPLPPSWAIEVEGRPKAGAADADEEEEAQEDGLCMCCFDGTSAENNRIVFCDGCNASMHQVCYGIAEIPEGDYYCDRCKFIEKLALTLDDIDIDGVVVKETVKCCLCNLNHGGIKPTTDGRWVHVCCALWAGETEIMDMKDMSPINIGNLVFQPFPSTRERKRNSYLYSETACIYCRQSGGLLMKCSFCQNEPENDSVVVTCNNSFHPLCAWFAGATMKAVITDPSYEAREREGRYPDGIQYQFRCHSHSDPDNASSVVEAQKAFRIKYRINETDLEQVPGKAKRKRKKHNKKKDGAGGTGRKATSASSAPKELLPDNYNDTICACCMRPVSNDIFGNDYNSHSMSEIPSEDAVGVQKVPSIEENPVKSDTVGPVVNSAENPLPVLSNGPIDLTGENSSAPIGAITNGTKVGDSVTCANCKLVLHRECWLEFRKSSESTVPSNWLCGVCKESDFMNVHCALCPRRGGFFCHTVDGTWAHPYCAKTIPAQTKVTVEKRIDIRLISKEGRKQKCAICNRKGGICIQCSCVGCVSFFHPLCAARSNKGFVRIRNGAKEAFCHEHIPVGVEFIAGFWLDGTELFRFRLFLDRARLILDTLVRREKLKRTLCKTEAELMQTKISKLLDKAKGRKTKLSSSNVAGEGESEEEEDEEEKEHDAGGDDDDLEDDDDESIDEEIFDEFVPLDYLSQRLKKKTAISFTSVELSNGESVDISNTWLHTLRSQERKNQSIKKLVRVYFAGIEIKEKNTTLDRKSYIKHQKNYINTNEDQLRTGIFAGRSAEEKFLQELPPYLMKVMKANEKELKSLIQKEDETQKIEIRLDKVKFLKNEVIEEKGHETPSSKKKVKGKQIVVKRGKSGVKKWGSNRGRKGKISVEDDEEGNDSDAEDESEVRSSDLEDEAESDEDSEIGDDDESQEIRGKRKGRKGRQAQPTSSTRRNKRQREEQSDDEGVDENEEESDEESEAPAKKKAKKVEEKDPVESAHIKMKNMENSSYYKDLVKHFPALVATSSSSSTRSSSSVVSKNGLTGFDQYLYHINDSQKELAQKINLSDWKPYPKNQLYRLERILLDFLECLDEYFVEDTDDVEYHLALSLIDYIQLRVAKHVRMPYTPQLLDKNEQPKTPTKQKSSAIKKENASTTKKSQGKKGSEEPETNGMNVSPINGKHRKKSQFSSQESSDLEENGRKLCTDFDDIPYEVLPNYDENVKRIMTINIMREKLHLHYYHSFAAFMKDLYLMLNNARSVTASNSLTWKDTKLIEKLFHESRILLQTTSWSELTSCWKANRVQSKPLSAKKGRKSSAIEVPEPRISTRRKSGSIVVKEEDDDKATKDKKNAALPQPHIFTCHLCKLQHEVFNWPEAMRLPDVVPESYLANELDVKMEADVRATPVRKEDSGEMHVESEGDGRRRSKRFKSLASPELSASLSYDESKDPDDMDVVDNETPDQTEGKSAEFEETTSTRGTRTPTRTPTPAGSLAFEAKITRSSLRSRSKDDSNSILTIKEETPPVTNQKSKRKFPAVNSASSPSQTSSGYYWICGGCVQKRKQGRKLLHQRVEVWWHGDECTYAGVLDAFDEGSRTHRVLYDDGEWEFIYLPLEAFLVSLPTNDNLLAQK